ncbi:uncharacterized protein N7511_003907 [Penicillium nucicola]|uniref:uncharacterized protein n=1 Tax=Penicillium nucicola TaxID=1850975 RepID=UPI002545662E|nr:uncharacterized protein N7511_003907 [Penicillium nucicola]KAJ5766291.1 hypothetical protein N7511_003907 [Penicillium nucicola]
MTIEDLLSSVGTEALQKQDFQQLNKWNAAVPSVSTNCVHDLIRKQNDASPDEPAVCSWDGNFTYRELDESSTKLARLIMDHGVTPRTFVPICMEKSCWTVVAILAILKAGAAFSLLDPSHPQERLKAITQDLGATVVLTDACSYSLVDSMAKNVLIVENIVQCVFAGEEDHLLPIVVEPHDPLYVVFTSGSTGSPKGVLVSHSAYATSAAGLKMPLMLCTQSRVLQFASYAFDVSVSDHLLTLLAGGCICIPSEEERKNCLASVITRLRVNWTFLTPSMARFMDPIDIPCLNYLVLGGEPVIQSDIDKWSPYVQVIGLYGPAEVAAGTTVNSNLKSSNRPTNIGNSPAVISWVVNQENRNELVPIGTPGELLIEGWALSQGYINKPDLTESVFISPPVWLGSQRRNVPGKKMYMTGDLVRYQSDGSLEYLGRKDSQVKLRGQRIELEEIEFSARQYFHGSCTIIADVVCDQLGAFLHFPIPAETNSNSLGRTRGLKFSSPSPELLGEIEGLASYLKDKLPSFMNPEFYVCISNIPLTPTGKTNRRLIRERASALSAEEWRSLRCYNQRKATGLPLTSKEETMQRLWVKTLRIPVETISRSDDWFNIGGTSLSAMQLVNEARKERLEITVKDVFQHRTLRQLAFHSKSLTSVAEQYVAFQWLGEGDQERQHLSRTVMDNYQDTVIEDIYPADDVFQACQDISATIGYNLTARVDTKVSSHLDRNRLSQAWGVVVQTNPVLRSQFLSLADKGYQVILKDGPPLEIVSMLPTSDIENIWGLKKFLVRMVLDKDNLLSLFIHHTLYDEFGLVTIYQQLERAYHSEALQPYSYGSYLSWLSNVDQDNENFWKNSFAGYHAIKLPTTPLENQELLARSQLAPFFIPLRKSSSPFTVDNKATLTLALVLSLWTKTLDVVFASVNNRRGAPVSGITEMVCAAVMPLPTRVPLEPGRTISDTLDMIQGRFLNALPFQNIGWYKLEQLSPELSAACSCWALMNVQAHLPEIIPKMFSDWKCSVPQGYEPPNALYLDCVIHSDSLKVDLSYDPDIVGNSVAQSLLDAFVVVYQLVDGSPHLSIDDVLHRDLVQVTA